MMRSQKYWNESYKKISSRPPSEDSWLEKHLHLLGPAVTIIDLGCGDGADTVYLRKKGINTTACDFSKAALNKVKTLCPDIKTMCFDMRKGLPFRDGSIDIVISDLSLHYFRWKTTVKITEEIARVLRPGGSLVGRVNSVKDINFGAMQGRQLAHNYYYVNGYAKRFFDSDDIRELFNRWEIVSLDELSTNKYGDTKILWEFCVRKK
jgi:SAM-dependent methyltransferase